MSDRRCPCGEFDEQVQHKCPWAAKLIVQDADTMSREQTLAVASWLRDQANDLELKGRSEYAITYTARYGLKR